MGPGADALAAFGLPPQGAARDPTAAFQDLAELLDAMAASLGKTPGPTLSMTDVCVALFNWLELQVAGLRTSVLPAIDPFLDWLDTQSHPILGIGRETHARWAALARAGISHGKALQKLQGLHLEVMQTALTRCREDLQQDDDEAITSVHALSQWWSETVDQAYRERALQSDYARAFGEWINSASALKRGWADWQSAQSAVMGPWFNTNPAPQA
ncbi:MAG: Poly(R)-hydroxyalkanoic acid synthase subunit synth [Pseudomonadota bacterium]|jgi:hypothetical protein